MRALREEALRWIEAASQQLQLFSDTPAPPDPLRGLENYQYLGSYQTLSYEVLQRLMEQVGYSSLIDGMLHDLVIMRIAKPASKLRSIELLERYFGITHRRQRYYESAPKWLSLKGVIEQQTVRFAQQAYGSDLSLVFYDLTTLYFETFEADELRKPGFSKDN